MATSPLSQPVPLATLLAAIPGLPRPVLSRLVARMIERLDEIDGDPDLEANGDEQDTGDAEDEELSARALMFADRHPGCPISDPGKETHDVEEEPY